MDYLSSKNGQEAFSTLEIMLALAIVVLALTAVVGLVFGSQRLLVDGQNSGMALEKSSAMLAEAKAFSRADFYSVNSSAAITDGLYQKSLSVQDIDEYTKQVTGQVSWQTMGHTQEVDLDTLLTDLKSAVGGSTCSQQLTGDWQHPQIITLDFASLIGDPAGLYPLSNLKAYQGKLYAAVNNTSTNSNKTFFVFDVANPAAPALLSKIDNSTVSAGPNAVVTDGHYAYVANGHGANFTTCSQAQNCAQLQIIDLTQTPPAVISNFKIPGVTGSAGQSIGQTIIYKRGLKYIGLAKTASGPEFNIIDVSNPLHPALLGTADIGNGINAIYVRGHYAYVASPNNQELMIFDITNPVNPIIAGNYDAPGGGGNAGNGKSLALAGNSLYLGRTGLSGNEFYILDNSNSQTALRPLGSKDIKNGSSNLSVNGIVVRSHLAFLAADNQFQIWDVSDPANINQSIIPAALPGTSSALDCDGNVLYLASVDAAKKGYVSVITSAP